MLAVAAFLAPVVLPFPPSVILQHPLAAGMNDSRKEVGATALPLSFSHRLGSEEFVAAAKARGKPLSIPESIPSTVHLLDDPTTWSAWFTPYFDLIRAEGIAAFCYSNRDYTKVPAWSDWGDLRIERSPLRDAWESVLGEGWVANAPFND